MGFLGIIRSIEDLLYEIMTWLVFYPRTLLKLLRHPLQMTSYSDREQDDAADEQYTDTLSPPIFLILTVLLCHAAELALGQQVDQVSGVLANLFANSEETLLIYRLLAFSIVPLVFAVGMVNRSKLPIDRKTLREPFFSQCYLGALYVLIFSAASIIMRLGRHEAVIGGFVLLLVGTLAFVGLQALRLRLHLQIGHARSLLMACGTMLKGVLFLSLITAAFSG